MCYTSVAAGLTIDIGIWWRIVFPVFFWQLHSTLFEIAWCIMLYLGVLSLEFSHAVLERLNYPRLHRLLRKLAIVFVIAGIALSTLHQSSLGTLFLATPYRLHPLWHTDLLPLFFFLTAIGLGCLTISWVSLFVHWIYGAEQPMDPVSGLARISAIILDALPGPQVRGDPARRREPLALRGELGHGEFLARGVPERFAPGAADGLQALSRKPDRHVLDLHRGHRRHVPQQGQRGGPGHLELHRDPAISRLSPSGP